VRGARLTCLFTRLLAVADAELLGLVAAGERAAFRGAPGQGLDPLDRAIRLAEESRSSTVEARARWLLGVSLNAMGQYGRALNELTTACAAPEAPTEYRSLAAAAVASLFRQLGRHQDARDWDRAALEIAAGSADAQFDAWLGLAADAVGLGDSDQAFVAIAQSEPIVVTRPLWWRQKIRLDWVRAEVSLLRGDTSTAKLAAERALDGAETAGAPRHVAKSLLFAGIAAAQSGRLDDAAHLLARAGTLAEGLGARPIVWPARAVLAALVAKTAPADSERYLASARLSIRQIADELPAELAATWLERPDVSAILA
jgi:tetratricopeptide (TPR) repeat protein